MTNINELRAWVVARAQERSTVAGIVTAAATVVGWAITPEHADAVATLAGLVASAIAIATKEAPK